METRIMNKEGPKWSEIVSSEVKSHMTQAATDIVTAKTELQNQARAIIEDKQEQDEINKRRCSVIIHGLAESFDGDAGARTEEDEEAIVNLLHEIGCDEVSVNDTVRLGRKPTDNSASPRPVLLTLTSEGQKDKILRRSKNLKGNSNGFAKVFIHQDLTPKQREKRNQLVREMKLRRVNGENSLIIVNDQIVTKRKPERKEESSAVSGVGTPTQIV
jgi:hypothetical protein